MGIRSIVHPEIEHVPVKHKPDETQTSQQHQQVPHSGPEPIGPVLHKAQAADENQHCSQSAEHADDLEEIDAQIELLVEVADTGSGGENDQADGEDEIEGADHADPGSGAALAVAELQSMVIVPPDSASNRPEEKIESHDGQAGNNQRLINSPILQERGMLVENRREAKKKLPASAVITAKGDHVLAVKVPIKHGADLLPGLDLASEILGRLDLKVAVAFGDNIDFADHVGDAQKVSLRATAAEVSAGDRPGVRGRGRWPLNLRRSVWEITIQEIIPQRCARADLPFAGTVVGNKKAYAGVEHEVKIAMEINSVAAVADNPLAIA